MVLRVLVSAFLFDVLITNAEVLLESNIDALALTDEVVSYP